MPSLPKRIKPFLHSVNAILKSDNLTPIEQMKWMHYNWKNQCALYRGIKDLLDAYRQGESFLLDVHARIAGKAPIPPKQPIL